MTYYLPGRCLFHFRAWCMRPPNNFSVSEGLMQCSPAIMFTSCLFLAVLSDPIITIKCVFSGFITNLFLFIQLTWHSNTNFLVKKAYARMIILHKLFEFRLPMEEMINIYILYIRSILESSAVVWHSSITKSEEIKIERVQKTALKIILASKYENYMTALEKSGLKTLSERRKILCKKFAKNCIKTE